MAYGPILWFKHTGLFYPWNGMAWLGGVQWAIC